MKSRKKVAVMMLTAGMAAACLTACGIKTGADASTGNETTMAETIAQETEPDIEADDFLKVGDTIHGFTVDEITKNEATDSDLIRLTHQKTGAQVLYIANEDTNRGFGIAFKTPASDTGISHVFEHATLSGSEKYPADIFFQMQSQTCNTFINAYTDIPYTFYPIAAVSDEQLLRLADYYLDGVFHPLILTEKSYFDTEGWRYEMESLEDDLTINGTVYNEMKGVMTASSRSFYNMLKTMYPGSNKAVVSGGDPDIIPDLTWEDVVAYHGKYYVPSNSLSVLYGKIDYEKYLELIDNYFDEYEEQQADLSDSGYTPADGYTEQEYRTETGGETNVIYSIACPTGEEEDVFGLLTFQALMNRPSSGFQQKMLKKLPETTALVQLRLESREPLMAFQATGIDPEQKEVFKNIVDESIQEIITDGIDSEELENFVASQERYNLTLSENSNFFESMIQQMSIFWYAADVPKGYYDYLDYLTNLKENLTEESLKNLVGKYLADPDHSALIVNIPDEEYEEEKEEALAAKLAGIKAGMTDAQLAEIVAATNAETLTNPKLNECIQAVNVSSVDSLREELDNYKPKEYPYTDETVDHVRYLTAEADIDKVSQAAVCFDLSGFTAEQLQYLSLYSGLLTALPTSEHTIAELSGQVERYADITNGIVASDDQAYFVLEMTMLNEDIEHAYNVAYELLFDSDYRDTEYLKSLVMRIEYNLEANVIDIPQYYAGIRARAKVYPVYALNESINGLTFGAFLKQVEKELEEDPETVVSKMQEAVELLKNKQNAASVFAGNEEGIEAYQNAAEAFFRSIPYEERGAAVREFAIPAGNEAFIIDSDVNYNMIYADTDTLNMVPDGKAIVTNRIVIDKLLIPQLRYNKGAYGVASNCNNYGVIFCSNRDPQIKDTFDYYETLGDEIRKLDLTEDELEGYIVASFVADASRYGALTGAYKFLTKKVCDTEEGRNSYESLVQRLDTTVEAVLESADYYDILGKNGVKITIGNKHDIMANADLYDQIQTPFGE